MRPKITDYLYCSRDERDVLLFMYNNISDRRSLNTNEISNQDLLRNIWKINYVNSLDSKRDNQDWQKKATEMRKLLKRLIGRNMISVNRSVTGHQGWISWKISRKIYNEINEYYGK